MKRGYWGRLAKWAALVAGVAFCLYWAFTGTLSPALMLLSVVLGVVAASSGFTLESNAGSFVTYGMSTLILASLEESWFDRPASGPAIFSVMGATSVGLGLICFWIAAIRGSIHKSYWFGPSPTTWGERIILLCFFAVLGWALFITISYSTQWGWDIWRAIRGIGQVVLLLLVGQALLPRRAQPAPSGSQDPSPPLAHKP